jgi:hypothetical protein
MTNRDRIGISLMFMAVIAAIGPRGMSLGLVLILGLAGWFTLCAEMEKERAEKERIDLENKLH